MYGNIRKPMLKSAMAAENKTEPEQPGEGTGGMPIFILDIKFRIEYTYFITGHANAAGPREGGESHCL